MYFLEDYIMPAIFLFLGAIVLAGALHLRKKRHAMLTTLGADEIIGVGKYLAGFPGLHIPMDGIQCAIAQDDFVFLALDKEIARIPRNSINAISVEDKSTVSRRFTVTRLATLGIFALALKKKKGEAEFCVVIDWTDDAGERQNAVFQFSNLGAQMLAGQTADKLNQAKLEKIERLKQGEKKCPYCAEVIKAEAKKCRYCQSVL